MYLLSFVEGSPTFQHLTFAGFLEHNATLLEKKTSFYNRALSLKQYQVAYNDLQGCVMLKSDEHLFVELEPYFVDRYNKRTYESLAILKTASLQDEHTIMFFKCVWIEDQIMTTMMVQTEKDNCKKLLRHLKLINIGL